MFRSRAGVILSVFFALLVMGMPRLASAQDMPPIFAPRAPVPAPQTPQATAAPAAQAVIPPRATASAATPTRPPQQAVAAPHPAAASHRVATAAEKRKFAALLHQLAASHRAAAHHENASRVLVHVPGQDLPPGAMPPPSYYPPGPYQRLVYGGPYSGWGGYRRPFPYYP
jgi:hypothetical protein